MKNKLKLSGILLIAITLSSAAFETILFPGWKKMPQRSPTIVIAACTRSAGWQGGANLESDDPEPGGIVRSRIRVLSVLKGQVEKPNTEATVESQYWMCQGED